MSRVDYGQVEVALGEESVLLKPTPAAMLKIDRQFGSMREAIVRVQSLSAQAMIFVIAAGANLGKKDAEALTDKVFEAGLFNLSEPLGTYLALLLNPTGADEEAADDGEGKP